MKASISPAAQAVLDAAAQAMECPDGFLPYEQELMAAALRAAAYQVVPARPSLDSCCEHWEQGIRHKLLAIAAELEGAQ